MSPELSSPSDTAGAARAAEALSPGAVLGGYIIQHALGKGAFGITYLALDASLKTQVAIKEYFPRNLVVRDKQGGVQPAAPATPEKLAHFQAGRNAFLEEARTLARFKHPHIVRILSFFEAGNTACFVMDYERGQSLKALLRRRGALTAEEVADLLTPLLDGLEHLHGQDVLHRDIKPGNIYMRQNGEPVLLDFGAACGRLGDAGAMAPVVTEGYAPPEQYQINQSLQGPWTDCYALAAVALRCLTGATLPSAPARQDALAQGAEDPLAPLLAQAEAVAPAWMLAVLRQGLQLDPDQRLRSVRDWRQLHAAVLAEDKHCQDAPASVEQAPGLILLVTAMEEHGEEDAAALRQCLPVKVRRIATGEEALRVLSRESLHGCIVDALLEDMSGMELLRRMRDVAGLLQTPLCYANVDLTRELQLEAASLGACALLSRPVGEEGIQQALQHMALLRDCHAREVALLAEAHSLLRQGDHQSALRALDAWLPLLPLPEASPNNAARNLHDAPKDAIKPHQAASKDATKTHQAASGDAVSADRKPEPAAGTARVRGAALTLFSQGCKGLIQGRIQEAGLAWAMGRKAAALEAEARIAMADAHRMAGRMHAFANFAQHAHQAHQLLERMDLVAGAMADTLLLDERRPLPMNTVGVQLRRAGELAAAELAYAVAVELSPYDPRVRYNLAKALAHGGKHKEAFDEICRSLKLDPEFEEAEILYRKVTGKAWHTGGSTKPPRSLSGMYQPLLDV